MRQKTEGLTRKQKEVLDFIKQFHAQNKYPPSIRQICSAINLSSPATVHVHINHLVEKGYIKRSGFVIQFETVGKRKKQTSKQCKYLKSHFSIREMIE